MDSEKIKALITAVNTGSLTAAADELGYTQAGLTQMMNRLENEVGVILLHRDKNGVCLTSDGERLLPQMQEFLLASQRFEKNVEDIRSHSGKTVRIGTYTSVLKTVLPETINSFKTENPDVRFEIRDTTIADIYNWVATEELDVGFGSDRHYSNCRFIGLYNDPLFAVLPKNCTVGGEYVDVSYFDGKNFIMPTYGYDPDIRETLEKNGVKPIFNATSVADSAVPSLVEMGMGVSILPGLVLRSIDTSGIVYKKLKQDEFRKLGLILPKEKTKNPLVRSFISHSEHFIKEFIQLKNSESII